MQNLCTPVTNIEKNAGTNRRVRQRVSSLRLVLACCDKLRFQLGTYYSLCGLLNLASHLACSLARSVARPAERCDAARLSSARLGSLCYLCLSYVVLLARLLSCEYDGDPVLEHVGIFNNSSDGWLAALLAC